MERDTSLPVDNRVWIDFNSHAHVERDIFSFLLGYLILNFNSHAHVERDSVCKQEIEGYFNFNSHAHVERDYQKFVNYSLAVDFNSHAHVERDIFFGTLTRQNFISTHTLTWSVTGTKDLCRGIWNISTHTLTWSVTGLS